MYAQSLPSAPFDQNPGLQLALSFHELEKKGFTSLFAPFYGSRLFSFFPLFTQLVHETYCKNGKGQTVFGDVAPEFQHHSLQRLLGGRKDCLALFFRQDEFEGDKEIEVPEELEKVTLPEGFLSEERGMKYSEALKADFLGVHTAALDEGVPHAVLNVERCDAADVGALTALLQCFAVYSALLRDVNPLDQPAVEDSKKRAMGFREKRR